jgi:LCP family protein required for cell wall assembly
MKSPKSCRFRLRGEQVHRAELSGFRVRHTYAPHKIRLLWEFESRDANHPERHFPTIAEGIFDSVSAKRWPRVVAATTSGAILAVTAVGAGATAVLNQLEGNITALDVSEQTGSSIESTDSVVIDETTGETAPFNVLLMGSDSRVGKDNRGYGSAAEFGTSERSDTTILLHVNADRSAATAVSIPRDTLITLPQCKVDGKTVGGGTGKFNEAMTLGGPGCTLKAVEEMSGMTIDNFMVIDFGAFKRITEAIGGVEICLSEPVNDPLSGLKLDAGTHIVSGEEALAFVRARKTLGDGSDTSRIRRQQAFLSSMARQVLSSGTLLNPASLLGVLNAATESLTADPQLANIDNLRELAVSMKDLRPGDITFTTLPWYPAGDGANVLMNKKKAKPLFRSMINDTPWPPKAANDQPLLRTAPQDIRVEIINGTGIKGAGKKAKKELRSEGFNVVNVKNGPTVAQTTLIYDPGWDVSAKTIAYSAGATIQETQKGNGATMQLIIGPDFTVAKPVTISEALKDKTANVNTADESFCAS